MLIPTKSAIILCFLLLSCMVSTLAIGQDKTGWLNDRVTIRFQEEPMNTVLGKIAQQTGIAILYDENLSDQKVTGYYKDIKFSEAINRLFSQKNKSIQVFKNEKKIIVKTFGAKQFVLIGQDERNQVQVQQSAGEKQMTLAELEKLHKQQYKEYKEWIASDNEILVEGMTRKQIQEMAEQQDKEYMKRLADENEVMTNGMTRKQIREMAEQQDKEYMKRLADENELMADGMTRKQIREIAEQQDKEYIEGLTDENNVMADGMSKKQIQKRAEQQDEKYNEQILLRK
ncbi:hypothetical protein KKHLCK_04420 [Candidatus Electrothrix laxa]